MDTSLLRQAGLTDGESRVYLALLELGPSTTGPIVERSGITKSIIYRILHRLEEKGLASHVIKEKIKHFQAASPSGIMGYMEQRQKQLEEDKHKIEEFLPKLAALQKSAKPNEAQVYFGFKGMISVQENTYSRLLPGEEYFSFGIPPDQPLHHHAFWKRDHPRRVKAGIRCRLLFHPKTPREVLKNRNSYKGCDARYMPAEINAPVWITGYKDVTAISVVSMAAKEPITIEITNQNVADSFRAYFEEFWKKSRPFSRKT